MRTLSVRYVQRNLAGVIEAVQKGQEITITKRGTNVARIVPVRESPGTLHWPDSAARMKRLGPRAAAGTPASRIIDAMRGEPF